MIRTFIFLPLLLILGLLAAGCKGEAKPKLAVVDADIVFTQSVLGEKGNAYFQSFLSDLQAELEDLQKKVDTASDDEKQAAQEEIQVRLAGVQQQANIAQQHVGVIISESFDKALEAYRARNGYDMILHRAAVLASGANIDVTMSVLDELNSMAASIDFSLPPADK
jgi:Skp family chaperone for outer membrane proteins